MPLWRNVADIWSRLEFEWLPLRNHAQLHLGQSATEADSPKSLGNSLPIIVRSKADRVHPCRLIAKVKYSWCH